MNATLHAVVLDCPDPKALAAFYSALTGWTLEYSDDDWVTLRGDGTVRLSFQLAPDHQPPRWPDPDHPQQFHIDFWVDDHEAGEARALELGATLLDKSPEHASFRVYADPAGHPFCLCLHTADEVAAGEPLGGEQPDAESPGRAGGRLVRGGFGLNAAHGAQQHLGDVDHHNVGARVA